jgi:hypothetical protein
MEKEVKRGAKSKEEAFRRVEQLLAREVPKSNVLNFQPANISMFRLQNKRRMPDKQLQSLPRPQDPHFRSNDVPPSADLQNSNQSEFLDKSMRHSWQQKDACNNSFFSEAIYQQLPSNNMPDYFSEIPDTIDLGCNVFITYFLHAMEIERLVLINKELTADANDMDREMTDLEEKLEEMQRRLEVAGLAGVRSNQGLQNEEVTEDRPILPGPRVRPEEQSSQLAKIDNHQESGLKDVGQEVEGTVLPREERLLGELDGERARNRELSKENELMLREEKRASQEGFAERKRTNGGRGWKKGRGGRGLVEREGHEIKKMAGVLEKGSGCYDLYCRDRQDGPGGRGGLGEDWGQEGRGHRGVGKEKGVEGREDSISRRMEGSQEGLNGVYAAGYGRERAIDEYGYGSGIPHQYSPKKDTHVPMKSIAASIKLLSSGSILKRPSVEGYTPLSSRTRLKSNKLTVDQKQRSVIRIFNDRNDSGHSELEPVERDSKGKGGRGFSSFSSNEANLIEMAGKYNRKGPINILNKW